MSQENIELFLVAVPGLEEAIAEEARACAFANPRVVPGGVCVDGGWPEVWRANLEMRGPSRVLARIGSFGAVHLAQLDKKARAFPWSDYLRADVAFRVEASSKASRIYHTGAIAERIGKAIAAVTGAPETKDAAVCVMVRIEKDLCTLSLDSSGALLHKRGHKLATAKAPMRETMAAMFLRQCGYDGLMPLIDPMCGSGTFVIEAAEMAAGLKPGRTRDFAFEQLKGFSRDKWDEMRRHAPATKPPQPIIGRDIDAGAIRMSRANAERAAVAEFIDFAEGDIRDLRPPDGAPGLIIVNPPYGTRIGDKRGLNALHVTMGRVLRERFRNWRVALVTGETALAKATGLDFTNIGPPVAHGGLRVRLHQARIT